MNYTKTGCWIQVSWRKASSICSDFDTLPSSSCINILSTTYQEEFEDTKGVIRIPNSKKNRQHNGQKKKYKRTNNDLQNIHIKQKIEYELKCSGRVSSSCSTSGTRHVNLITNPVSWMRKGSGSVYNEWNISFVTQIFHSGQPS
jgi:hypothetical protein